MGVALKASGSGNCTTSTVAASMSALINAASGSMTTFYDADVIKLGDDIFKCFIYYV